MLVTPMAHITFHEASLLSVNRKFPQGFEINKMYFAVKWDRFLCVFFFDNNGFYLPQAKKKSGLIRGGSFRQEGERGGSN